jgi:DNA-binding NtrC family response regulator
VLVVEDDVEMRRTLERYLTREGCIVTAARDGQDAAEKLQSADPELIITDLEMPRADGREVVALAVARRVPVVVLTGHSSVKVAVELMRRGAANFLTKPFEQATLRALLDDAFGRGPTSKPTKEVIGKDGSFRDVLDLVTAVAETDATMLITGESGTGKEVVARTIHRASRRSSGPFVAVNCGAIPEALLESELFGHAKGAFTGATQQRAGRFQLADGGTLFLDEIGDMPLSFQVKLLRVMQERQFEMLGDTITRNVDVRVVAATHRDLAQMVVAGSFREDLFYRLNVVDIHLPPLRERTGDIPLLAEHFIAVSNSRHGTQVSGLSPEVVNAFTTYRWPGNVRELGNVIERMVIFKKNGVLEAGQLPAAIARPSTAATATTEELPAQGIDLRARVAQLEDSLIDQALQRTGGNRNAAAQLLGLNRTTLVEKLRRKRS